MSDQTGATHQVQLQDDFYRDGVRKLFFITFCLIVAILILIVASVYLYVNQPKPLVFSVQNEMRVQDPVAINLPYLSTPELLQWIGNIFPKLFTYDFNHYQEQLSAAKENFTDDGWQVFLNQLNIYANYNNVQKDKLFVQGSPTAAPYILKEGLLTKQYAWWVQMPIKISFNGPNPQADKFLTFQILIVRVPTLNNLYGVGIENVIVAPAK